MFEKINQFKKKFIERERYLTKSRIPFYDLAAKYLPKEANSKVVDVGCGYGKFAQHTNLLNKYENIYLLDGNEETIKNTTGTILYQAPNKMPFEDNSIDFLHCSHLIEHLYPEQLHSFLQEIHRVLKEKEGILVISAPLFWDRFYGDMSHIRPYYPEIFTNYFCRKNRGDRNPSKKIISQNYEVIELVYRYRYKTDQYSFVGSKYFIIDFILKICKKIFLTLGFKKYFKTGYTIILRKG